MFGLACTGVLANLSLALLRSCSPPPPPFSIFPSFLHTLLFPLLAGLARRVSIYLDRSKQGGECCISLLFSLTTKARAALNSQGCVFHLEISFIPLTTTSTLHSFTCLVMFHYSIPDSQPKFRARSMKKKLPLAQTCPLQKASTNFLKLISKALNSYLL